MYYPCSENKDADQLRGYREADLRLCFRQCKLLVFSRTGSDDKKQICSTVLIFMHLATFFEWTTSPKPFPRLHNGDCTMEISIMV